MGEIVFSVGGTATELGADEVDALKEELKLLVREAATYDAAGADLRIDRAESGGGGIDLQEWPHADTRALARALDHLWNLDRALPPPLQHRRRHELREHVADFSGFEPLTYDRLLGDEGEIFHSYTGPYEAGDRLVDLSGRALRVVAVEAGGIHERLSCEPDPSWTRAESTRPAYEDRDRGVSPLDE